jgi:hypothetical protein
LWLFIWSLRGTLKLRNLSFFGSDQMDNLLKDHILAGKRISDVYQFAHPGHGINSAAGFEIGDPSAGIAARQ